jgi:hypothetical protein
MKKWIQKANLKEGALHNYMQRRYGGRAFTPRGTIKPKYLHYVADNEHLSASVRRRANLALTMRRFRH